MPLTALAFTTTAALVVIVPGPDQALLLQISAASGRSAALCTVGGILVGIIAWGIASIVGLSTVIAGNPLAFRIVSILGGVYLIWLGIKALHSAFSKRVVVSTRHHHTNNGFFLRGLFMNCLNPKIGLFYLSILPQFLPSPSPQATYIVNEILLVSIYVAISALWLFGFAFAAGSLHPVLNRPRVRRPLESIVGAVLLGLGVLVLAEM